MLNAPILSRFRQINQLNRCIVKALLCNPVRPFSCRINFISFASSNAKDMPASVCDALKEAFRLEGGLSLEESDQMLVAMERAGRFQSETWS